MRVRNWLTRRLLGKALGSPDFSDLRRLPRRLTLPLRRDGLDPVPRLGELRSTEPVSMFTKLAGTRIWLVTGYDEVRSVLSDATQYSNDIRPWIGKADATGADAIGGLGFTDPPDHTRLRKYLTPEFTRRRLARLQPRIEEIVHTQLDALAASSAPVDLVSTFSFPVPFQVIWELLGLPDVDREEFQRLGTARFDASQGMVGVLGAASEARTFLIEAAARQRSNPGEGLLGSLVRNHGDAISDVELGSFADGLFLGGYETSASMLSLGTLLLLQNREAYDQIRREPETAEALVEEMLRYLTVVQVAFPRFARVDHDLGGHRVRAGDVVACSLSGANRDLVFGDHSERFDPRRELPTTQLAFGHGIHRCIGAELARMELRTAFRGLASRFPHMTLAVDVAELTFRELSIVYGVERLPVFTNTDAAHPADSPVPVR